MRSISYRTLPALCVWNVTETVMKRLYHSKVDSVLPIAPSIAKP